MDPSQPLNDTSLEKTSSSEKMNPRKPERTMWKNKFEFAFNMIGYSVSLGALWRFSYLCFKNGGGSFLMAYLLLCILIGFPMLFLETAMGQYTRKGCMGAWFAMVPLMRGVGIASLLLTLYLLVYYMVVVGWCILYLFLSFTPGVLPWASCDNAWNSADCVPIVGVNSSSNIGGGMENVTRANKSTLSTAEFWNNYVIQKTSGIHDMGGFSNWKMVGCVAAAWTLCYGCVYKGIQTSGKAAYFTVIIPYALVAVLFVKGLTLEGASTGVLHFITPNITRLAEPEVWLDAGGQILFSLGVCYGTVQAFGSYNRQSFNCYKSSYLFIATLCLSSFMFGIVVFSFLGHMAFVQKVDVKDIVEGGPGLVFQVIPAELSLLPLSQIWCVIFFVILVGLAVDGAYGALEACFTSLADFWPEKFDGHVGSQKWRAGGCVLLFVISTPQLLDGGIYIFEIFSMYGGSGIVILWIAFFETFAIGWVYGAERFFEEVSIMINYRVPLLLRLILQYVTPSICLIIFIACCVQYVPLRLGDYIFPWWANVIGWFVLLTVVLCIPFLAVKFLIKTPGSWKEKWKECAAPKHVREEKTKELDYEVDRDGSSAL